ncbi:MAG TPA: GYD domain-containing protein [Xanthobacteraceae bacterium]|nr:GYD domain-containing protein [Xanthobacteraceae bacterium]
MPKYLVEARYTAEGAKGLLREGGSGRRAAIANLVQSVGGKLEAAYFAFGDTDVYIIADLPDNITAAAVSLAANQTGFIASKTIVLMTPEEIDQATKKTIGFRPPGS